ncbi:unnamed protein product, partial [Symbiodinium sp. CCMP2592]
DQVRPDRIPVPGVGLGLPVGLHTSRDVLDFCALCGERESSSPDFTSGRSISGTGAAPEGAGPGLAAADRLRRSITAGPQTDVAQIA